MEPGAKIGEGAGSEVYAWGDADALKLFSAGTAREVVEYEAHVTRLAHEAGAPAPEVRGLVEVDGRYGIVFPRYDGEPLLHLAVRGEVTPSQAGRLMAVLQHALHAGQFHVRVRTFRDWVVSEIPALEAQNVPSDAIDIVRETLLTLPPSGVLCHGDLHPGNILVTHDGPFIIDWISALDANPFVDVAREHVTLTMIHVDDRWAPQLREAHQSFITTYAGLTGVAPEALLSAIAPYVTVMAAMRLLESNSDETEREPLIAHIRLAGG